VKISVHAWRSQRRQRFEQPASPQALDAWETRSIIVVNPNHMRASEGLGAQEEDRQQEREAVSAHR
jgi:hypothetical protein